MKEMTTKRKIAQKRLTLLQLADRLWNISEACRHHRVSRSQLYEYKRIFPKRGLEELFDRSPIAKSYPYEIPPELRNKIISLSLEHPAWGSIRIASQGISVSPSTVSNIWIKK